MSLSAGSRLGPYEILAPLGEGGMGEVYRGRDSKLGREVALKVLSPTLVNDADYMARFEREAQVLASLNHLNIAAIYGLEDRAIVMELVEGGTLADRIAAGPIPLTEVLTIARQIAAALEYAHEKNVIHRDLKPANVKITQEGTVKVLDFGLAKIAETAAPQRNPASSPTLTLHATKIGVIMGTAAYMAPEQASGKPVDKRADIWSFGVVLWEMISGRTLFDGETVSHTLAHVLTAPLDSARLPPSTPAPIRELVHRCLDRDSKKRLRDIGEARIAIDNYLANPIAVMEAAPAVKHSRLSWVWTAAATLALIVAGGGWWSATRPLPKPLMRFAVQFPEDLFLNSIDAPHNIISPDGYRVVSQVRTGETVRLAVRSLDQTRPVTLAGTEGATHQFFSPDGSTLR